MTKQELREHMSKRLPLSLAARVEKSKRICERITRIAAWHSARTVILFAPQTREPDVELLWKFGAGRRFAYPRIEGETLALYAVESSADLKPTRKNLREPLANPEMRIPMGSVDLVVIPGVAFTEEGLRCGRGGGYYDRLLAALPAAAVKVGVCFTEQLVEELPMENHDIEVDMVIAE